MRRVVALPDDRLLARVVSRRRLTYVDEPDPGLDRPAHVRAASGVVRWGSELAVVQDDASFLAIVDPFTGLARAVPFPAEDGVRLFDDGRGNKALKLDLEACLADFARGFILAFGSGSTPRRERLVRVTEPTVRPGVEIVDASELYARLRGWKEFAGSELNLEGAARVGDALRLFQRGNGRPIGDLLPVDATCDLDWDRFVSWLDGRGSLPEPHDLVVYDLGAIGEVRLTFADAAMGPAGLLYLAAAEDSPDAVRDGPVSGLVLGMITEEGARYAPIVDEAGQPLTDKAEGLAQDPDDRGHAWMVVDPDDPDRPSELCELRMEL